MRVLVVSAQFPFPPRSGFTMRVYQLLRQLAQRHEVTLLSYARPTEQQRVDMFREELSVEVVWRQPPTRKARQVAMLQSLASRRPFCVRETYSSDLQRALERLCATQSFDVVQLEASVLSGLTIPDAVDVVLDEHNIEYEIFKRTSEEERSLARRFFHRLEYQRCRRFEQSQWTRVDGCVVTSPREEPIVRAYAPSTPTEVVPNGVDLEYFSRATNAVEPYTLVFNGTLDYRPNLVAAQYLVDEIWPKVLSRCPEAKLTIVGRAQQSDIHVLQRPGVLATGEVPDVRPYLQRAAVAAVPITIGGGTRLKVAEGLAMGKAMVSTSLGCEGIDVRHRTHLLIADDPDSFAAGVLELFDDPRLRETLGAAGRTLAEQEYSWDLAGARLESLYQRIASDSRSRLARPGAATAGSDPGPPGGQDLRPAATATGPGLT